jgi:rhomboid family GlyGly-CTERM serine protease
VAGGVPLTAWLVEPGRAWVALAVLLGAGALLGWWLPAMLLDWQPALAWREPWRAWSAAFVHWSALHLGANLLACVLVAALGRVARLPVSAALAWLCAWPFVHLGLLAEPALAHYGGLSGVLHAAVAVAGWWLAVRARGRARAIGLALLAGLVVKLVLEDPFGAPLARPAGWDIAIAPLAHATGVLAGSLAAGAALIAGRQSGR